MAASCSTVEKCDVKDLPDNPYQPGLNFKFPAHSFGRVDNIKIVSGIDQYWGMFILLKVSSVRYKTQVTTFPYGGFRGAKFQIESRDYGVKIFMINHFCSLFYISK